MELYVYMNICMYIYICKHIRTYIYLTWAQAPRALAPGLPGRADVTGQPRGQGQGPGPGPQGNPLAGVQAKSPGASMGAMAIFLGTFLPWAPFCHGSHGIVHAFLPRLPWYFSMPRASK